MMEIDQSRRSFALGLAGVSLGRAMLPDETYGQAAVPRAYVLGPSEGEHLILRGGNIFIKAEPNRGSNTLAMGTQQFSSELVFQFTDTLRWTRHSTLSTAVGLSF